MKKICKVALMLAVMIVAMTACTGAEDQLKNAVEECNKECPLEVENGIYLASFGLEKDCVEINVALDKEIYGVATLEDYCNAMGAEIEKLMVNSDDKDTKALIDACRETGRGLVVNVMWNDENDDEMWEYRIDHSEL